MTTLFFDIDTQFDFMYPAGALYVPGAERLIPAIAQLNRYAAAHSFPVISSTDAHSENDAEFSQWPPHCVAGTLGQQKVPATLLDKRAGVPTRRGEYVVDGTQQIIIEKQALDLFTNSNLAAILERLQPERCVVYGVVTEYCVRCAAMGLLRRARRVEVVTDAIQTLKKEDGRRTLDETVAHGGSLITVADVIASGGV
jgi:nicotinamidase/pyrazinamidase